MNVMRFAFAASCCLLLGIGACTAGPQPEPPFQPNDDYPSGGGLFDAGASDMRSGSDAAVAEQGDANTKLAAGDAQAPCPLSDGGVLDAGAPGDDGCDTNPEDADAGSVATDAGNAATDTGLSAPDTDFAEHVIDAAAEDDKLEDRPRQ